MTQIFENWECRNGQHLYLYTIPRGVIVLKSCLGDLNDVFFCKLFNFASDLFKFLQREENGKQISSVSRFHQNEKTLMKKQFSSRFDL